MIPIRLIDSRTLTGLSRGISALAVIVAAVVVICLGRTYMSVQAMRVNEQSIAQATSAAKEMDEEIARGKAIKQTPAPSSDQPVFAFQIAVESAAMENGAVIEEYSSSPERTPYLSKYHNDPASEGWQQAAARVHLSGRMPEVFATLRALRELDIPFEIDNIELVRGQGSGGQSRVSAQINLRVLVRA